MSILFRTGATFLAFSVFVSAQSDPPFEMKLETLVNCASVRLVSTDATLDLRDQDVNVERVRLKGHGKAGTTTHLVRRLHTNADATVSFAKVTSGHYLIRMQASGEEVLATINLPDFTHLGKCIMDLDVAPMAGKLAIEEKN